MIKAGDIIKICYKNVIGLYIVTDINNKWFTFDIGFMLKDGKLIEFENLPDREKTEYIVGKANSEEIDMVLDYINKRRRTTLQKH